MNGSIAVDLNIDSRAVEIHTTSWSSGAGAALTLASAMVAGEEPLELISVYLSHPSVSTTIRHLCVTGTRQASNWADEQPYEEMNTLDRRRACCYEHLQALVDELQRRGLDARVFVDDSSFQTLESAFSA